MIINNYVPCFLFIICFPPLFPCKTPLPSISNKLPSDCKVPLSLFGTPTLSLQSPSSSPPSHLCYKTPQVITNTFFIIICFWNTFSRRKLCSSRFNTFWSDAQTQNKYKNILVTMWLIIMTMIMIRWSNNVTFRPWPYTTIYSGISYLYKHQQPKWQLDIIQKMEHVWILRMLNNILYCNTLW